MLKINNKGFTLVELLAVIVVLAIIMAIAIPSVMKTMENAKKSTFKIYAQKVMTKAEEKYQSDILMNDITAETKCYSFADLGITNPGNYRGKVMVVINTNLEATSYTIFLSDASYSVSGITSDGIAKIGDKTNPTELGDPFPVTDDKAKCS